MSDLSSDQRAAKHKRPQPWMDGAEYDRLTSERLKRCMTIDENGCWIWQRFAAWNGYGGTIYRGKGWRVHRLSYHVHKGPIPEGHDVCHTCDVRLCINPDHLWTGPRQLNNRDTRDKNRDNNSQKTECPSGHSYAEHGVVVTRGYRGWRQCNRCNLIRNRIRAGWPRELAETLPVTPRGQRPVGGKFKRASRV